MWMLVWSQAKSFTTGGKKLPIKGTQIRHYGASVNCVLITLRQRPSIQLRFISANWIPLFKINNVFFFCFPVGHPGYEILVKSQQQTAAQTAGNLHRRIREEPTPTGVSELGHNSEIRCQLCRSTADRPQGAAHSHDTRDHLITDRNNCGNHRLTTNHLNLWINQV